MNPGTVDEAHLPSISPYRKVQSGVVLRTVSPCGGGYGDPLQRDPASVLDDVLDDFVTVESAAVEYGVIIDESVSARPAPLAGSLDGHGRRNTSRLKSG